MITNNEVLNKLSISFSPAQMRTYTIMRSMEYGMLLDLLREASDTVLKDREMEINETEYNRNWWFDKHWELEELEERRLEEEDYWKGGL